MDNIDVLNAGGVLPELPPQSESSPSEPPKKKCEHGIWAPKYNCPLCKNPSQRSRAVSIDSEVDGDAEVHEVSPDHPIELLPPKRPIVAGEDEQDVESSVEDAEVVNSESDDSEGGGDGE